MGVLSCDRCGLEIKIQAEYLQIKNCPRCLARAATVTPLTLTPDGVNAANGTEVLHRADKRVPPGGAGGPGVASDRETPCS